ncbi:MAG: hypothetical protein J6W79_02635 [Alphaproteobacteria bacterium]|nr:hypothetical protein [Alphaproteobacteria bacterium]
MTNQHEQDVITVLEHVKKYPYGYMGALNNLKKPRVVEELKMIGVLRNGHAQGGQTYALTPFGRAYIASVLQQKSR